MSKPKRLVADFGGTDIGRIVFREVRNYLSFVKSAYQTHVKNPSGSGVIVYPDMEHIQKSIDLVAEKIDVTYKPLTGKKARQYL